MRLLWVENHAVFARLAGRQFLANHVLTVVPSVAAAKATIATQAFDAVLVDYDLDDGTGVSVVEFVRQSSVHLPVVGVSSHEDGNTSLLAAGADAVCPKTRFVDIESVLRSVVRGADS